MASTIVSLFDSISDARNVIRDLVSRGFRHEDIHVVSKDLASEEISQGKLVPNLMNVGVPEEAARTYDDGVHRGGTLVTVSASDAMVDAAMEVMYNYGAVDVDGRAPQQTPQPAATQSAVPSAPPPFTQEASPSLPTSVKAKPPLQEQPPTPDTTQAAAPTAAAAPPSPTSDFTTSNFMRNQVAASDEALPLEPPPAVIANGQQRLNGSEVALPVVEEELQVEKRAVERGGLRVHNRIIETPVEQTVRLREEHVTVERRPVDRLVNDEDLSAFKEGTIEFIETYEEPIITKRARVVEEIIINKNVEERIETIRDSVRRTNIEIEQLGDAAAKALSRGNPNT